MNATRSTIRGQARFTQLIARDEWDSPSSIDTGTVSRLLRIHGESDAHETSVGLAAPLPFAQRTETNSFSRLTQRSRIIAGIKMATCDIVEGHLLRTNQAADAQ
jgi:hypothetical protein